MVTNSEKKGLAWIKKEFENSYIKKLPDFKQTNMLQGGLPDYLVIKDGIVIFIEIKLLRGKFLTEKDFTSQQLIEFTKIAEHFTHLYVLIVNKKDILLVEWDKIYSKFINKPEVNKISIKQLEEWKIG